MQRRRIGVLVAGIMLAGILTTAYGGDPQLGAGTSSELPKFSTLKSQTRELLRLEADARSLNDRVICALRIIEFADQLRQDPRFRKSPTLNKFHGWLASRLRQIEKDERKTLRRRERTEGHESGIVQPAVLAQLNAAVINRRPRQQRAAQRPPRNVDQDYGPLLVELIQRTISPGSWDVRGGKSTIVYYRPAMALVVRAPEPLHGKVTPLLGQLRAAN